MNGPFRIAVTCDGQVAGVLVADDWDKGAMLPMEDPEDAIDRLAGAASDTMAGPKGAAMRRRDAFFTVADLFGRCPLDEAACEEHGVRVAPADAEDLEGPFDLEIPGAYILCDGVFSREDRERRATDARVRVRELLEEALGEHLSATEVGHYAKEPEAGPDARRIPAWARPLAVMLCDRYVKDKAWRDAWTDAILGVLGTPGVDVEDGMDPAVPASAVDPARLRAVIAVDALKTAFHVLDCNEDTRANSDLLCCGGGEQNLKEALRSCIR